MTELDRIAPELDIDGALSNIFDVDGKVVFLPGGYGDLGEAICWGLAQRGASVVIAGRNDDKAGDLARRINERGFSASSVSLEATDVGSIGDAVDLVAHGHGRIDVMVNCVGIQREEPMLEVTESAFDEVYRANLRSAMFLAQAVARVQQATGGKQVHLLSVRAKLGLRNRGYSAYCATKGGLVMLIKQHAVELADHGITVNGVAPTFVYTEMIRHVMENPEFRQALNERIPLGRIADPRDVVGPVLFFSSPASDFVTGQVLYVDGGITASQ